MFSEHELPSDLDAVRATYAPGSRVYACDREFETLDVQWLDDLASRVNEIEPLVYPAAWVPETAPSILERLTRSDLVIGFPEHGSVTWTRQTTPAVVLIRPRGRNSPADFLDFLIAEAFVQIDRAPVEHFLGFFEDQYLDIAALCSPSEAYQLGAALYTAYVGLDTFEECTGWDEHHPRLFNAWQDAGDRLAPRLADLPAAVNRGDTAFADAVEYACSAVKHDLTVPSPFGALDSLAYREYGAEYAVQWIRRLVTNGN